MLIVIGTVVVLASIIAGYTMHGGQLVVLFQVTEFIIIGGAALGSLIVSNPLSVTRNLARHALGAFKGAPYNARSYEQLLGALYQLAACAKREGAVTLEQHYDKPHSSSILRNAPTLLRDRHGLAFLCDSLRSMTGGVDPMGLEELMDKDLETIHQHEMRAPNALTALSESLPGLGIVAAVLGIVITMGKIDQPPAVIGHSVAGALVGTFLGILLCYGFAGPLAKNIEHRVDASGRYLQCIKTGVLALAKYNRPDLVVEYARRTIALDERPSFAVSEAMIARHR